MTSRDWKFLLLGATAVLGIGLFFIFIIKPRLPTVTRSTNISPVMSNEEVWEWLDHKGNKRQLTVHRDVREK